MLQLAAGKSDSGNTYSLMTSTSIPRFLLLVAATTLLSMCGSNYGRATLRDEPDEGAVLAEPASRSGSSPEGGSSSPTIGRTALPPEQPRR